MVVKKDQFYRVVLIILEHYFWNRPQHVPGYISSADLVRLCTFFSLFECFLTTPAGWWLDLLLPAGQFSDQNMAEVHFS